ncbi:cell cycle checkpoint control protein RAD9B isoform X2 [Syngnathoides biaculeatus]|uniref:cell cycle checkpoint control protein RAD9B isoform X2 n=1 Tax=Syngnathoides biaculeatus TaxID=300417 RepID=UPI002ADD84E9|nr:cell cycle checkpoint control protein RAD9B isoform X2 [Syngnathoides biaculeatus]
MNCALEGHGIKVFGKAIHALSRVGDELWLDPMVKGLALRSVNSSQSAYACFFFSSAFFHNYSLRPEQACQPIKCRLYMKSLLPLFRCLTSIERNVERCQISVNTPNDRVMIQFSCKHGISKTHNLCYQESAALQAVFDSHLCPNVLKSSARLFASIIMHFQRPQEEVTLSITPLRVSLKSYHEGRNDHMKMLYTEMSLHPDEFDYFLSGMDSAVTFCLKELRGLVSFAELHCLPVSVQFGAAGKPVCFSVEDTILEATLVLATLIDSDSGEHSKPTENPGLTPPRCADAAVGANSPNIYAELEVVPSSQGSPINPSSPSGLLLQLQKDSLLKCVTLAGTASPASSTICHLLFRASSSEQDNQNPVATVLACDTDMEENE